MRDDQLMDELLRDAMAEDAPRLADGFDARVMARVRPRRLTRAGRVLIGGYAVAATATAAWLMHGLGAGPIVAAMTVTAAIAAAASAYARSLDHGH